jgi:DNA repair photolyase
MNYKVCDNRIMVSFGEKCAFKCKYCYTSAPTFENYPNRDTDQIVDAIRDFPDKNFENIYVSCDMEAFVDQKRAIELIEKLATLDKDIHFTTKMNLSDTTIRSIARINDELNQNGRMLIPAITICAMKSSKELEPYPIPPPYERIKTIIKLSEKGLKVILAMRPFLPSVSISEYKEILDRTAKHIECVLGGVLFLDLEGSIEKMLGYSIKNFKLQPMYFIDKPGMWKVYMGEREQRFVEEYCKYLMKDFFMTSPPAIESIKRKYLRRRNERENS